MSLVQLAAQPRGKALYDVLTTSRELTKVEGNANLQWLPNEAQFYQQKEVNGVKKWLKIHPETQAEMPLFDATLNTEFERVMGETPAADFPQAFKFVQNGNAILIEQEEQRFYYDLLTKKGRKLQRPKVEPQPLSDGLMRNMQGSQLWNGEYSASHRYFAYVKGFDLWIVDTENGTEKAVSNNGSENIFNGRPNWVYPEEFGQLTAYWFSPDEKYLAFYQSDESAVHKYPIVHDYKPEAEIEFQSYPKAGEPNPTVKLLIYEISSGNTVTLDTQSCADNYIVRPQWRRNSNELLFMRMNRQQNELEFLGANPQTGAVRLIQKESESQFINLQSEPYQFENGSGYLWQSELSGFNQLASFNWEGQLQKTLTSGTNPVNRVVKVDEKGGFVYYTTAVDLGLSNALHRVKMDGTGVTRLTTAAGMHNISMDGTATYFIDGYSNFEMPTTVELKKANGQKVRELMRTNVEKLTALGLQKPELIDLKAADGTTDLHGLLFRPADFDSAKKYPIIVSVYGGPHTKQIRNSYQMRGGLQALAQLGFVVFTMDNRGLIDRGKAFETATYLKLGEVDVADQVAGLTQLLQKYDFIDANKVGVFGHSYGGYMTSMLLLLHPDKYHVGVAGALVTDWRNYDTIYTERYMDTPQRNKEGYDKGSAMQYASQLKGKLLLVHGSTDNNVHPGNTMQLIAALTNAGKDFDLKIYPENRHGIVGEAGKHYTNARNQYFMQHLLGE